MSLLNIQHEYKEEYSALDEEEREEIVKEYKENIHNTKHIAHPSPRGCIQDFSNTVRNIILLVCAHHSLTIFLTFSNIHWARSMVLNLELVWRVFFALCETH